MMGHILVSFVFFNILLIIIYKHYRKGEYFIKTTDLVLYTLLLIAFGTYGGGEGDYWTYKMSVEQDFQSLYDVYFDRDFEIQYNYLAFFLGGNYTLWRLVIYSVQFIGMSWLLYKAKLNTYSFLICFISICLVDSIYGRVYWGIIYFFLGVFLIVEKKNPLCLIIIALCYVSHTQNLLLLALLPLSFVELKRWHLLVVILLFGILVSTFKESITDLLDSGGVEGADQLNYKMKTYDGKEGLASFGNSIGEITVFVFKNVPAVSLITYLLYVFILKRKMYLSFKKPYRRIISITFGLLLMTLISLASGVGGVLFYRVIMLVFFPLTLLLPYLRDSGLMRHRTFDKLLLLFIFVSELGYVKDIYYAYVGGRF